MGDASPRPARHTDLRASFASGPTGRGVTADRGCRLLSLYRRCHPQPSRARLCVPEPCPAGPVKHA
ncbi:hypothetical protein FMEAI12_3180003 [Parafrankia sp. Ea1.12]|nr:hypothetical protein FMEAI12_3180003 [Parafrankia sp. Ea1.12]